MSEWLSGGWVTALLFALLWWDFMAIARALNRIAAALEQQPRK